jgi:abequosyltransferase
MAVKLSEGKYCWLFTDDDLIINNSINEILPFLIRDYNVVVINADVYNLNFSKILYQNRLKIYNNIFFSEADFEQFFHLTIHHLSFIGALIIKKKIWLERERAQYFGTEFVHVGVLFQKVIPENIVVLSKSFIKIRLQNAQWTSRAFEIWAFKWPKLINSFTIIQDKYKKRYPLTPSFERLKLIIEHRAGMTYNFNQFKKFILNDTLPFLWKFILFLISIIPTSFLSILIKSYQKIKK